jgi:hypothetical protein
MYNFSHALSSCPEKRLKKAGFSFNREHSQTKPKQLRSVVSLARVQAGIIKPLGRHRGWRANRVEHSL